MTEMFHCHGCGAEAGIGGQYSDDPDERADEYVAEAEFREDWDRDHAACGEEPVAVPIDRDDVALRLGQMLMWLDENVADLTIMKTGGEKFTALIMDRRPSIAMSATSIFDLIAGATAELFLEKQAG